MLSAKPERSIVDFSAIKHREVKMAKKLSKEINGSIITIKEVVTGTEMVFNFMDLPTGIQDKFGPFGLGHKLGDAAAGKSGQDAVNAINKVWKGLLANDWSVRAPAGEKITKKSVLEKVSALSPAEQVAAKELLSRLGLKL